MKPLAVGIDLGTTYSVIAALDDQGRPIVIPNAEGQLSTPSVVFVDNGSVIVGEDAKQAQALGEDNVASFFKRWMGNPEYRRSLGDQEWSPEDLSAQVLRKLVRDAEALLKQPVKQAVITVPAYFDDHQRRATISAGLKAGLDVLQIINEPTAAALALGLKREDEDLLVLVYDLGGGTFDVTLVDINSTEYRVLGTDGDHQLGGKDWDDTVARWFGGSFEEKYQVDIFADSAAFNELRVACEEAKKKLSDVHSTRLTYVYQKQKHSDDLTREKLQELTGHLLERTATLCEQTLADAGKKWSDLAGVLLVGGSTRMPMVREYVNRMSGKPGIQSVSPDHAVAEGAALCAGQLLARKQTGLTQLYRLPGRQQRIVDVMSHSMGMIAESSDGTRYINSIIIKKNLAIPCVEMRPYQFVTTPNSSNEIEVYATQGESPDPFACTLLRKYRICGLTHQGDGGTVVDISYHYNENGVVDVTAVERARSAKLTVIEEPIDENLEWLSGPPRRTRSSHVMAYLAVDLSGSMAGTPLEKAKEAAVEFLRQSDLSKCSIGLVVFSDKVRVELESCQNAKAAESAIKGMQIGWPLGYGNMASPFAEMLQLLKQHDGPRFVVLMTDGMWCRPDVAISQADACREAGIQTIAIGFGSANKEFLERVATTQSGAYFTTLNELTATFGTIAREIAETGGGQFSGSGKALRFVSRH